jgi:hypothetical protein
VTVNSVAVQRLVVLEVVKTNQPYGSEDGERHLEAIDRLANGHAVALDMSGMRLVDSAWSRVVLAGLLERHRGRRVFWLENVTPVVAENVDAALFRCGVCILARYANSKYEVLGKKPTSQALQVLSIVERERQTSARAVCAAVRGLSMPAANNRLHDLVEVGLLVREEEGLAGGGREFVYRALR